MAMRREGELQTTSEDASLAAPRIQELLSEAGFDAFVEEIRLHTSGCMVCWTFCAEFASV
jgi:hypothetical protein